jgi:peptidoglycan/xylan/chitin deacetylase (PgdA/CDA1 family)
VKHGGHVGDDMRERLKRVLGDCASRRAASGLTVLIYHRVGAGTPDEMDVETARFGAQLDLLGRTRVLSLDGALDELEADDDRPKVVLTFDDGFADVHDVAFPLLAERGLPFTLYLATAFVGGQMHWDGSTAKAAGPALTWEQCAELAGSPLCTIGNHTDTHARPEALSEPELDRCTRKIEDRLGVTPRHFAYTWGVRVPSMEPAIRERFRSAATGELGRNHPGQDPLRLRRIPVRGSDPPAFFAAKLTGRLLPERAYAGIVATAKRVGLRG